MTEARESRILIISTDRNLREVLRFCFDGWGYDVVLFESSPKDVASIKKASPDVIVVDVQGAKRPDLEICSLLKDDFITALTPVITLINKRQLRSQLLNIKKGVDDYLIKPPDPLDLRVRVEMAMKRAEHNFYSSPLTGLPGGRILEEALGERIASGEPFAFGYVDLDNFKCYNDNYGYVKGDRAIMQTAYMLYTSISKLGNRQDFIGHIGGDDFAFITSRERYRAICHNFISEFVRIMPFHYSGEDRRKGYIVAKDRTHKTKNVPLMSVSVAVVVVGNGARYGSPIELNEKVAEVKRYLKGFEGSKFMADRRGEAHPAAARVGDRPRIYRTDTAMCDRMKPLGQVLLDGGSITAERLDDALVVHWRRGIRLGEILTEMESVDAKALDSALRLLAGRQAADRPQPDPQADIAHAK